MGECECSGFKLTAVQYAVSRLGRSCFVMSLSMVVAMTHIKSPGTKVTKELWSAYRQCHSGCWLHAYAIWLKQLTSENDQPSSSIQNMQPAPIAS